MKYCNTLSEQRAQVRVHVFRDDFLVGGTSERAFENECWHACNISWYRRIKATQVAIFHRWCSLAGTKQRALIQYLLRRCLSKVIFEGVAQALLLCSLVL